MRAALALLAVASLSVPAVAGEGACEGETPAAAEWRWVEKGTGELTSVAELTDLASAYPDSASVHRRLLSAQYQAEDPAMAETALQLVRRGFSFSEGGAKLISGRLSEDQGREFNALNATNQQALVASQPFATVPAEAALVEGVARDAASGTIFASTIVSRQLYQQGEGGEWSIAPLDNVGSLAAMALDPARGLIWIASGTFDQTPGEPAPAAALGYDPAQGKVARILYANGLVPLGDITVSDDGRIFAANPVAGEIHQANPDTEEGFRAFVGAGAFRSPQGMVKVPGRNRVIVSDWSYGLAAVDEDSGKVQRIASPGTHWLDGIDALLRYGQSLIAVQNGHQPMRIVRLDMAEDWLSITKVHVLEGGNPDWTEPVGATLDGDRLLYIATGQWDVFGDKGEVREGKTPQPTTIRMLELTER